MLRRYGGELLLDNASGLLCSLASDGDITKMGQLIEFGVPLDVGDYDMRTALHLAASEGRLAVVSFLTSHAADVHSKDRWGSAPIQDAIRNGFPIVARHLQDCGATSRSELASSIFCDAASTGDLSLLQMLADGGLDSDEGDYDARCALHLAAAEGQLLSIHFLLKSAKANPSPLDRWQATPLQDAMTGGHEMCVQLLLTEGAQLGPSATAHMVAQVEEMKRRWFTGNGEDFWDLRETLRRRITHHARLVDKGRARADLFDLDEAKKVNTAILTKQIQGLRPLCEDAGELLALLQRLEGAGLQPMAQMLRLMEDGEMLASAAAFWHQTRNESEKQKQSAGRFAKGERATVFDEVYIYIYIYIHTCITTYMYVYIYIYIYIHTHTHIHI